MTNRFVLLTKKQLADMVPTIYKQKNKHGLASAVLSTAVMVLLIGLIAAAFIIIFGAFSKTYVGIKINRIADFEAREYELMTMCYFALIVVSIFTSTAGLNRALFESGDLDALITMPFSSNELFLSKLSSVYLRQAVVSLVFVTTINFTFFVSTSTLTVYGGLMSFVVALILPIVPIAISSMIVLPFYLIKRIVSAHYLAYFAVVTLVIALFCVGYSYVFDIADGLISSGKITSFFNEKTMDGIIEFTRFAYPASFIANVLLGRSIGANIAFLIAISVCSAGIGLGVTHILFTKLLQTKFYLHIPRAKRRVLHFAKHSAVIGLLKKEFLLVLRTPSYSYMYFTTAVAMPVMAFYSARMGLVLIESLIGGLRSNFEVCTFIVLLYSTLTNTFCSTNVSRDGNNSTVMKTLPYSPAKILFSKILFCSLISLASVAITCIVFASTKMETPWDALATFASAMIMSVAQILFATRLDLNHPHFAKAENGEITESNSTVSTVIFSGLIASFIIGFALLFNTIKSILDGTNTVRTNGISYVFAFLLPAALLAGAFAFFFTRLKSAYDNLSAEV